MNMNFDSLNNIENDVINKLLVSLCSKNTELYLVGGYIRDLLLERPSYDRDYAIIGEKACEFAQKVAKELNGYYVLLDKDFDIARVVLQDKKHTLDFASCINQDIQEDLARRDYTINAVAYRIDGKKSGLIDPFNGIDDIKNGLINAITEQNLIDDPLRLLRAFRFASQLGFEVESKTFEYIKRNKSLIDKVAMERVNLEFVKLAESRHAARNLTMMKDIEFLDVILPELSVQRKIPENLHHHLGLLEHSIETVKQIELNINDMPEWVVERLNKEAAVGIKNLALLKVAALLHDLGKPSTWQIDELGRHRFIKHEEVGSEMAVEVLKRLKFSKNSIKYMTNLIKYHLYPSQLLRSDDYASEKAIHRMFRRIGDETPELLLLAMADRLSARGPEITEDIVNNNIRGLYGFLHKYKEFLEMEESIPKLLSGTEIMKLLNIPRGPEVGNVVKALKEAQIAGDVSTKEEAIGFVKGYYFQDSVK